MDDIEITHNLHDSEDKNTGEEHQNEEAEQQELHQEEEEEEEVVLVLVDDEEEEDTGDEEHEVEREEALSLCDLPLFKEDQNDDAGTIARSSSESSDLFEFFSPDLSSDYLCSADDVIFGGKIIPLNEQHLNSSLIQTEIPDQTALRKRSESLPSSVSRCNSTKIKLVRTSYSLDNRKVQNPSNSLSLQPEQFPGTDRNHLVKSDAAAIKKLGKPRWFVLMFGMVKFPAEMELNDIKSRQFRQNPLKKIPATSGTGAGPWKILKALSCKDHASVQATSSFYVPAS